MRHPNTSCLLEESSANRRSILRRLHHVDGRHARWTADTRDRMADIQVRCALLATAWMDGLDVLFSGTFCRIVHRQSCTVCSLLASIRGIECVGRGLRSSSSHIRRCLLEIRRRTVGVELLSRAHYPRASCSPRLAFTIIQLEAKVSIYASPMFRNYYVPRINRRSTSLTTDRTVTSIVQHR